MKSYAEWIKDLGGRPVFAAYPAGFDFTFVYRYLVSSPDRVRSRTPRST